MKKFKSLMLAALASAALAAPSFADGHSLKSSGEVVVHQGASGENLSKWEFHRDGTRKFVIYNHH